MSIDTLRAGPELDALIAEQLMGFEPWPGVPGAFKPKALYPKQEARPSSPPPYSTDVAAAWEIAILLRLALIPVSVHTREELHKSDEGTPHQIRWYAVPGSVDVSDEDMKDESYGSIGRDGRREYSDIAFDPRESSETAALALCYAALEEIEHRKRVAEAAARFGDLSD